MDWLFAEPAPIASPIAGLTVIVLVAAASISARRRAGQLAGTVQEVFWRDVATIGLTLAGVVAVPSLAALVPVEGVGQPLWIVLAVISAIVVGVLLVVRWRSQELGSPGSRRPITPTGAPKRQLVSTGWEIGTVGGGIAGLGTYLITEGHLFGHPIHWVIAVLGILVGYAVGIGAVTPRFRLQAPTTRRS